MSELLPYRTIALVLVAVLALSPPALWAQGDESESELGTKRYNALWAAQFQVFMGLKERRGRYLRVAAVLKACGDSGRAESVEKAAGKEVHVVANALREYGRGSDTYWNYLTNMSTDEFMAEVRGVRAMLTAYGFGYLEATRLLLEKAGREETCRAAHFLAASLIGVSEHKLSRRAVKDAQSLLNGLGYDAGMADGVLGARTRTAIRKFQRRLGLTPTGDISEELLLLLQQQAK